VKVELYADAQSDTEDPCVHPMRPVEAIANVPNASVYGITIATLRPPGDFTPRVVPYHPDARLPIECPLIAWQR
jgi:starch phosphorylase